MLTPRLRAVALIASLSLTALAGCAPATTYNRGIDVAFQPSGKADAQTRLVPSAIELNSESDQAAIKEAGGIYLGDLEVVAKKAGAAFMGAQGGSTLSGRISLEAASRGATHFYLASSRVENAFESNRNATYPTSTTHVRYVLFRVETGGWEKLPVPYRPAGTPSTTAAPASSPSATGANGAERKL